MSLLLLLRNSESTTMTAKPKRLGRVKGHVGSQKVLNPKK